MIRLDLPTKCGSTSFPAIKDFKIVSLGLKKADTSSSGTMRNAILAKSMN